MPFFRGIIIIFTSLLAFSSITQLLHCFELEEPLVHPPIDKRSSEEYEEFIKGSGRFPMGFGKRAYVGQTPSLLERFLLKRGDLGGPIVGSRGNLRQFIIATEGIIPIGGGWPEGA